MTESVGPYQLTQRLGRGGTGEMWLATDTRHDRQVVLTLLSDDLLRDPEHRERYRRDLQSLAGIESPHLLPVLDFSVQDRPYIVTPYLLESTDLATILRDGPVEPRRAVTLIGQVASALDAMHRSGLVHRDVKPSNILVTRDDDGEHAQLIDYALVEQPRVAPPRDAESRVIVGTPAYMAPELVTGAADHRADVYALAVTLYEVLTGRTPFDGDGAQLLVAHLGTEPPPLPDRIPPALRAVVTKGLAKNPDDRWRSAGELAAAAGAALAERPPLPSVAYPDAVPVTGWPVPQVRLAAGLLVIVAGVVLLAIASGLLAIGVAVIGAGVIVVALSWVLGRRRPYPLEDTAPPPIAVQRRAAVPLDFVHDLRVLDVQELTVYTSSDDGEPLRDAVVGLLEVAGFEVVDRDAPVRGSWFQRLFVRHKDDRAVRKLGELAEEAVRAAQLKYIATPRSESDEREANAIARLTEAMSTVDDAVVCTSSILLIKSAGRLVARVLTEAEIRKVQRNPELLRAPDDLLRALAVTPEPAGEVAAASAPQPCPECGHLTATPSCPACAGH